MGTMVDRAVASSRGWARVFRVKKLVGRRGAPELELLASNFPVFNSSDSWGCSIADDLKDK